MAIPREAALLRIFIGEDDKFERLPLYEAIVLKARELQIAGATVLRGGVGYGHSSHLHSAKILRLSDDLPLVIEIVDSPDKIAAFLPVLDGMMASPDKSIPRDLLGRCKAIVIYPTVIKGGFIFGGLRGRLPFWVAGVISAGIFGLFHYTGAGSLGVLPQLAVLGFALCWVYERTGSIYPTMAMHALNNALAFAILTT